MSTPDLEAAPERPLQILVVMRLPGYLRNCEQVLVGLAQRGHRVEIAVPTYSAKGATPTLLDDLSRDCPSITHSLLPLLSIRMWDDLVGLSRTLVDYLRYFDPRYAEATRLRARARKGVPAILLRLVNACRFDRRPFARRLLNSLLRWPLNAAPPHADAVDYLRRKRPDLVLFTPLLGNHSDAPDYLKAALRCGIPAALLVASWDNLSNKGLIHHAPHAVILWNERQKREAIEMHAIPAERISASGAHLFDRWFEMRPSTTREQFVRRRGLDPAQPLVLYVCSSGFIAQDETRFVERWIRAVRAARGGRFESVGILVRPHSGNTKPWMQSPLSSMKNVCVWPATGEPPADEQGRKNYFDSLYHADAVVGINTSAMIEAGILKRPVLTVLDEEFRETQLGTIHFHYMADGGLLHVSRGLEEHAEELGRILFDGLDSQRESREQFIREFIRPHGIERPCAPIAVDAIERVVQDRARVPDRGRVLGRLLLWPVAWGVHRIAARTRRRNPKHRVGLASILRHRLEHQA